MRSYVLVLMNVTVTVLCNVTHWFGGWVQTSGGTCCFPLDSRRVSCPGHGDSITPQKTVVVIFDKLQ